MPSFPVPVFAGLVLGFLGLRAWLGGETPRPILVLIAACAAQTLIVAGRLHYGVDALSWVQPVLAMGLPPLAWCAFVAATRRPLILADLWHLAGPGFAVFARVLAPDLLEVAIPFSSFAYAGAMLANLQVTSEMAHARLGAGERPLRLWRWAAAILMTSGGSDLVITVIYALGQREWLGWVVTLFSTGSLLALGTLLLGDEAATVAEAEAEEAPKASEEDATLIAALEQLMVEKRLWLDPDLTLARIARRMGVPAKVLSGAVNRVKGENISRVVNGWRVGHAAGLLKEGASVTEAMLASGFSTKSNFNREFLRVMGRAPRLWLNAGA